MEASLQPETEAFRFPSVRYQELMDSCLDAVFEMVSRKAAEGAHLAATVVLDSTDSSILLSHKLRH